MKPNAFTKSRLMRILPFLILPTLGMQGCRWDESMYDREVCTGICTEDLALTQEACTEKGYDWIEPTCTINDEIDNTITSEADCTDNKGTWHNARCSNTSTTKCAEDKFALFKLYDLGNGQYVMKEGTQYYCGSYNDLMDTDKPKASCDLSNKDIKAVLKDIEYGLCNVDTTCEIGKEIVKTTIDGHTQYTYQDIAICSTCHFENAIICDGKCVDMMRNPNACGGCGNVCKQKESCIDGICQTKTEEKNCCGDACKRCESNEKCSNGKCIIATECDIDEYKCFCNDQEGSKCTANETPEYKVLCVNPKDSKSCGATDCEHFGKICHPGQACVNGNCVCPGNLVMDTNSGECLDPKSEMSCGATLEQVKDGIITQCGANEYCEESVCRCKSGYARENDDSPCIDVLSDNDNCGKINHKCPTNSNCNNGQCICDKGLVLCGSECIEPRISQCCGFEVDENSKTPFDTCNIELEDCNSVVGSAHIYECACRFGKDENGNCIDTNSNNKYCGDDKDNCENIIGGAICVEGSCKCNNDKAKIKTNSEGEKVCAEVLNDPNCCGDECKKCDTNQVCEERKCQNKCESPKNINCNGHCLEKDVYHVEEDENNPGNCICTRYNDGVQKTACPDVSGQSEFGCRTAIRGDHANCGVCGNKCREDQLCDGFECMCSSNDLDCKFAPKEYNHHPNELFICIPQYQNLHILYADEKNQDCKKCEEGFENLDGDWANGCEVDLKTTTEHCGSKDNNCRNQLKNALGITCKDGKCIAESGCSNAHFMDCNNDSEKFENMEVPDGCETDITSSAEHCGKCGNLCATGAICEKGSCCYSDTNKIDVSRSQFQCCSGNNLYEYKPHFAFPFCWGSARYACSTEKMDNDSCWRAVE